MPSYDYVHSSLLHSTKSIYLIHMYVKGARTNQQRRLNFGFLCCRDGSLLDALIPVGFRALRAPGRGPCQAGPVGQPAGA